MHHKTMSRDVSAPSYFQSALPERGPARGSLQTILRSFHLLRVFFSPTREPVRSGRKGWVEKALKQAGTWGHRVVLGDGLGLVS